MRDENSLQPAVGVPTVESVNARRWSSTRRARNAARARLRPAETALVRRHRDRLRGDVLELGPAGGSLTTAVAVGARSLTGTGPSRPALELCRARHPTELFLERDIRDLACFDDGVFDAVIAGRCALDVLSDAGRREALGEVHRVLAHGGVLIFSSHNLGCESLLLWPSRNLTWNPIRAAARILSLPRALRNHTELRRLQQREPGYAVLNASAEDYSTLQYYISRDAQQAQLAEHGFELLECVTVDDDPIAPGEIAFGCEELYYAACALG